MVGLAIVLPWTTWLRLSAPSAEAALLATPLLLFTLAALGLVALELVPSDPWLAAFLGWAAILVLRDGTGYALETAQWITFGALLLAGVRRLPATSRPWVRWGLLASAGAQALYVGLQTARFDPLFAGWGWTVQPWPGGTLGNPTWVGAWLALAVPLAPWPLAIALLFGVVLTQSAVALIAAAVGLVLAHRRRLIGLGLVLTASLALLLMLREPPVRLSGITRLEIAQLGLREWWRTAPLLGVGPGTWWTRIPAAQYRERVYPYEAFVWAHSDLLQLLYEFGAVALVLLGGWLWWHRAMWGTPYAGALGALAVESVAFFPFHLATIAALAIVIVGLATPTARPVTA